MWQIFRTQGWLIAVSSIQVLIFLALLTSAHAQSSHIDNQTYNNSNTITHGLFLPSVAIPHGADEVRAGDGTTCRSALASNEGYLDIGTVGNQDPTRDALAASVYGRVIVPLGRKPPRINCRSLYELELQRLRHELEMAKMGANTLAQSGAGNSEPQKWAQEGWHDQRAVERDWKKGTTIKPQ